MKKIFSALSILLIFTACSTMAHRGVIAMKISDDEAHVGMGSQELTQGDHVELYRNECTGSGKRAERNCTKVSGGHGVVTQILNGDYSVVKFEPGTKFSEGDTVEKHAH